MFAPIESVPYTSPPADFVLSAYPVPEYNESVDVAHVVAAPHLAWLTAETLARSLEVVAENAARLAAGRPLLNQVA